MRLLMCFPATLATGGLGAKSEALKGLFPRYHPQRMAGAHEMVDLLDLFGQPSLKQYVISSPRLYRPIRVLRSG